MDDEETFFTRVTWLGLICFAASALMNSACTDAARLATAELLARKIQCALANQNLPNEEILAKCAVDPKDAKNVLDIVGQSRSTAAMQAVQAEARAGAACGLK